MSGLSNEISHHVCQEILRRQGVRLRKMPVTFHTYAGPSFEKLARKMVADGEPLPGNPILCVGFGAENEAGEIVAYIVVQSLPFVTPAHAEEGEGTSLLPLFDMAEGFIRESGAKRVICHSGATCHALMGKMIEESGGKLSADKFYDWRKP